MTNKNSGGGLGTFLGVYTPTILTILGVIMYLRFGWILGHQGLVRTLGIVVLANAITVITTLSFSSVATNTRVGVGGAYYIVSRSLGLEIGGAIGLPLFLSQVFSVTLYSFGLAESLRIVWPDIPLQWAAFVIVLGVAALSFAGARLALKAQLPIMALVGASLVALTIGAVAAVAKLPEPGFTAPGPSGLFTVWQGFAVFFPAVTGAMAGLGLSGDLKEPGRAIPHGSILAVLTGFAVYLTIPIVLSVGADVADLRDEVTSSLIWTRIAPLGALLVFPGLWGAIFSSAVGSMLGAPRTLQALARDGLAPARLGRRTGDWRELMPGLIVSSLIALAATRLPGLNAVAMVVTMFFLTTYGTVNVVAALETLSGDPSWRPRLRVPWPVSLLGAAACVAVMFLIDPWCGGFAVVAEIALWLGLSRRERTARWGDARRGLYETLIRWALMKLARRPVSARNWRPHILVFVGDPEHQMDLVRFGDWFSQGRGVVTVCELVVGDLFDENLDRTGRHDHTRQLLNREKLAVFSKVNVVHDIVEGITDVAQADGMAALESNTVLLGWPKTRTRFADFLRVMRRLSHLKKSLIIGRIRSRTFETRASHDRVIHIWWGGLQRNGDLMLLLSYLLTGNPDWQQASIRVLSIASNELIKQQTENFLAQLLPEIRIDATHEVFMKPSDQSIREVIQKESAVADVVFFGLASPEVGTEEEYADRLEELAGDLPTVFFVKNSSMFIGELVTPSHGEDAGEGPGNGAEEDEKKEKE